MLESWYVREPDALCRGQTHSAECLYFMDMLRKNSRLLSLMVTVEFRDIVHLNVIFYAISKTFCKLVNENFLGSIKL